MNRAVRAVVSPIILSLLASSRANAVAQEAAPPPNPVLHVDLPRYLGQWYEVAKIPNRFQDHCVRGATATYTLREDGKLDVVNRCRTRDGNLDTARGIAEITDSRSNAKLRVSFVSFLGWRPFWGDYWILALGDGYEYAVVGTPDRKYGWVLGRTPTLPPDTIRRVLEEIRAQGYDPDLFVASLPDTVKPPN